MPDVPINSNLTDSLSQSAHDLLSLDRETACSKLVVRGNGNAKAMQILKSLSPRELLSVPIVSQSDAQALLAGLWLWHDWLDESHVISQQNSSATGSLWHAIMHRREGDFGNSKYWYARCPEHQVLKSMTAFAGDMLNQMPADKSLLRLVVHGWDPNAMVDLVQAVHENPADSRHKIAVDLQKLEWRLLFEYCMRQASGQ